MACASMRISRPRRPRHRMGGARLVSVPPLTRVRTRRFFAQIVRAWSMQGFRPGAETGHDHFFATFDKFGWATSPNPPTTRKGEMLAAVAQINARQHVFYLETLVSRQGSAVGDLVGRVP